MKSVFSGVSNLDLTLLKTETMTELMQEAIMKTLTITANDLLIQRLVSLFEFFPKDQYELSVKNSADERKSIQPLSIQRGAGKNIITSIAKDFDEPLDDLQEYMS